MTRFEDTLKQELLQEVNRDYEATTLGPQPGDAMCCDSCRRVAQMLAHLLVANGYTQFAAELYTMLQEEAS